MRPSLYVVEDDPDAMAGLVLALGHRFCRFSFVGASPCAESALVAVECERVDLFLIDYSLAGDMDGIELTTRIKQRSPASHALLITGLHDPVITRRALAAGAAGVLHKPFDLPALQSCVRTILAGHRVLSDCATGHLLAAASAQDARPAAARAAWESLSATQRKVTALLIGGRSLKEVAAQLGMAFSTADAHRRRAYRKLGVHTLADATQKLAGARLGS